MKKQVQKFIQAHGGLSAYSGNAKTMYIHPDNSKVYNPSPELIEDAVIARFGYRLPFKMQAA